MNIAIFLLISLVIVFHIYAFIMEAILWKTPRAMKIFKTTPASAASSYKLAINQGVYNLFLAGGLIWSVIAGDPTGFEAKVFFLLCVLGAAITAGAVVSKRIMIAQGLPALIALALVIIAHGL